ncbi:hypothetical protein [Xanthocytophaga flava]|uniref:C4-dicarboxylate ABC transporter n=1 Tax=Xanthocytophaga agilis TaxID=3048010 RepID=A0AAE3R6H8_9BACT|nr:hypothetical protein [Xanthocytophaga flavus]MDJ1470062.1 hypothetical protein [Xanthocytophaga flavus]MDJ1502344.1 hypothetical protein [Xanthocytophaga agilis]
MKSHRPLHETIFAIFGIVMALVYVILGIAIIFTDFADAILPKGMKLILGIAIIGYGIFRIYRAAKQLLPS